MGGVFQKVNAGDPLRIRACTYNAFIDAARAHREQGLNTGRQSRRLQPDTGIVAVLNDSGADRARFDVLGISGVIIKPVDNADEFQQRVLLRGVVPTEAHAARFVVLLEPTPAGAIGQACVDGVVQVRVQMESEDDHSADAQEEDATKLYSSGAGLTQLLWVEDVEDREDPDVAWAVVRLGGGGGGLVGFPARVYTTGPTGQSDYTDARYWVREVEDTSADEDSSLILNYKQDGRWVTATNLVERGRNTHGINKTIGDISPGTRYVWVFEADLGNGKRYFFESYPGQIDTNIYAFLVECRDAEGCPQGDWYKMIGPAFVSQTNPPSCP